MLLLVLMAVLGTASAQCKMTITIVSATNVPKHDPAGNPSDPYVKLTTGCYTRKQQDVTSAYWNHRCSPVSVSGSSYYDVGYTLWDSDLVSDDRLASGTLSFWPSSCTGECQTKSSSGVTVRACFSGMYKRTTTTTTTTMSPQQKAVVEERRKKKCENSAASSLVKQVSHRHRQVTELPDGPVCCFCRQLYGRLTALFRSRSSVCARRAFTQNINQKQCTLKFIYGIGADAKAAWKKPWKVAKLTWSGVKTGRVCLKAALKQGYTKRDCGVSALGLAASAYAAVKLKR